MHHFLVCKIYFCNSKRSNALSDFFGPWEIFKKIIWIFDSPAIPHSDRLHSIHSLRWVNITQSLLLITSFFFAFAFLCPRQSNHITWWTFRMHFDGLFCLPYKYFYPTSISIYLLASSYNDAKFHIKMLIEFIETFP